MSKLVTLTESVTQSRLTEAGTPGRFLLRIIDAGEGSSGVYTPEVLEQAATDKVFPAGTHCYLDHAAALRRGPHGERSVRDLAAVLDEDARWDDELQGLVAETVVFGGDADRLRELAPHIGVSISASAQMGPPLPGGRKPTVRRLVAAESVDFVVQAGRGGAILAVLESAEGVAGEESTTRDTHDLLHRVVQERYADPRVGVFAGVRDFDPDAGLVFFYIEDTCYQQQFTTDPVTLVGDPVEVRVVTQYVPVTSAAGATETQKETDMPTQAELDAVNAQLAEAIRRAEEAEAKVAEAAAREALANARKVAAGKVAEATKGLLPAIVERVATTTEAGVTATTSAAEMDTLIAGAVEAETKYLAALTEGRLTGFGPSADTLTESTPKRTHDAFGQPIKEA